MVSHLLPQLGRQANLRKVIPLIILVLICIVVFIISTSDH